MIFKPLFTVIARVNHFRLKKNHYYVVYAEDDMYYYLDEERKVALFKSRFYPRKTQKGNQIVK